MNLNKIEKLYKDNFLEIGPKPKAVGWKNQKEQF